MSNQYIQVFEVVLVNHVMKQTQMLEGHNSPLTSSIIIKCHRYSFQQIKTCGIEVIVKEKATLMLRCIKDCIILSTILKVMAKLFILTFGWPEKSRTVIYIPHLIFYIRLDFFMNSVFLCFLCYLVSNLISTFVLFKHVHSDLETF